MNTPIQGVQADLQSAVCEMWISNPLFNNWEYKSTRTDITTYTKTVAGMHLSFVFCLNEVSLDTYSKL